MSITRIALENDRVTVVALVLIVIGGLQAFLTLPRAEDPGFTIRTAAVVTYFPGASPERVEDLVTDPIEQEIEEIAELDFVNSESATGMSVIMVNILESEDEMRPIWDDLRRRVESASGRLPEGVIGPFVNDEFGDVYGTVITMTGHGFTYREMLDYAESARDELLRVQDVSSVEIFGAQEEQIYVEYNNARLAELGLSPSQLADALASVNIINPGGELPVGQERLAVEPSGNFEDLEDLRRTVIKLPGQSDVFYLADVADVYRDYVDPADASVTASGVPALMLAISMIEGGNIIDMGDGLLVQLDTIQSSYPIGLEFDIVAFQPEIVDQKVKEFVVSLGQAIGIVLVVMLLFLGLRTGLVVSSLIPMAMIAALLVMSFFGIGLDQMSLASLIIALGMLVDNAIVMAESIQVSMEEGKKPREAAIDSAGELQIPLLTSSLTTACAFLPIVLAENATGEYTAPLFSVVTITLLCSWFLALTMVPLFCVLFMRVKPKPAGEGELNSPLYRIYRRLLEVALRFRFVTVALVFGVFMVAMTGMGLLPNIFFPPSDKPIFTVEVDMPANTPIETTRAVMDDVERFIAETQQADETTPGVTNWFSIVGEGAPRFYTGYNPEQEKDEYGFLLANVSEFDVMREATAEISAFITENYPDADIRVEPLSLGPPVDNPVEIRVSGTDTATLFEIVRRIEAKIAEIPGSRDVTNNWGPQSRKLVVQVDQERARRAGVTSRDIAVSLQSSLSGIEVSQFREDDDTIPIVLRSVAQERDDFDRFESVNVYSQQTGSSVPLLQVASVYVDWEPATIYRRDRLRSVSVTAGVQPGVTAADINAELLPWLAEDAQTWDLGYRYEVGGEAESAGESQAAIGAKMPIAMLLIIILLVTQFNSVRKPTIILMTIPLGMIGVVVGLLAAGSYFGFMTLLGVISLAGIVINNAIVLLDRIQIELDGGMEPWDAVIEAAQRRLRPILLTTCTTVGGLLPLWFGGGPMWEPMAIAIIFGLLFATVLTLGFVPVLYSIFYRVKRPA